MDPSELLKALAVNGPSAVFAGFLLWACYQVAMSAIQALREVGGKVADKMGAQAEAIDRLASAIQAQAPLMQLTHELRDQIQEQRVTLHAVLARLETRD